MQKGIINSVSGSPVLAVLLCDLNAVVLLNVEYPPLVGR
jgi:hypothetical protein